MVVVVGIVSIVVVVVAGVVGRVVGKVVCTIIRRVASQVIGHRSIKNITATTCLSMPWFSWAWPGAPEPFPNSHVQRPKLKFSGGERPKTLLGHPQGPLGSSLRCLEWFQDSHVCSSKDKAKAKRRQSQCSEAKAKPMQRAGQVKTMAKTSQGQANTSWGK